jgi:hypothetical protein
MPMGSHFRSLPRRVEAPALILFCRRDLAEPTGLKTKPLKPQGRRDAGGDQQEDRADVEGFDQIMNGGIALRHTVARMGQER